MLLLSELLPDTACHLLKLLGNALLVQHRVSGRVAVSEKPDVLWDRPDLERLYSRLQDADGAELGTQALWLLYERGEQE